MSIFKACDIRGVVGEEWDVSDARRIGGALGRMLRRRGQAAICVGGDFRRSTPALKQALTEGLVAAGADVHDVGQVPTPVVYFAARQFGFSSAAIVTASHNAGKYNGVKFMLAGRPAVPETMDELVRSLDAPAPTPVSGNVQRRDVLPAYEVWLNTAAAALLGCPSDDRLNSASNHGGRERLSIALDSMAGACTHLAHRVLAARGDSVVSLVEAIDLDFDARSPDPAQDANLAALQESVARNRCDLGVALDGDGDRVVFTDERSVVIRPEQIAALLIQECFHRPTVVYDLKCASLVPRAAAAANGLAMMRPSGHGFIKATMIEQQADLGVEVSGHHFFKALGGGDDGLFTALIVSGLVRRSAKTLSQSIARFAWPAITPDLRVPYRGDAAAALESIAASCGGRVSRLDGVRAEYDSGWALARASITEPAITFRFEASDRQEVHAIAARFLAGVPELSPRVVERIED